MLKSVDQQKRRYCTPNDLARELIVKELSVDVKAKRLRYALRKCLQTPERKGKDWYLTYLTKEEAEDFGMPYRNEKDK